MTEKINYQLINRQLFLTHVYFLLHGMSFKLKTTHAHAIQLPNLPYKAYQTICIYIELKGLSGKHVFFLNIS